MLIFGDEQIRLKPNTHYRSNSPEGHKPNENLTVSGKTWNRSDLVGFPTYKLRESFAQSYVTNSCVTQTIHVDDLKAGTNLINNIW